MYVYGMYLCAKNILSFSDSNIQRFYEKFTLKDL